MVNPRIYRACLALIAFAVIIFAFSLSNQPGAITTAAAPGQYFSGTDQTMTTLASRYPDRAPGSAGDDALAGYVRTQLAGAGGFSATTDTYSARTALGTRILTDVVASRPGLLGGQVVVVAGRDSPGTTGLSGTAVLLSLANALAGQTLQRTVTLISTSGSVGAAGATHLAAALSSQPIDAVIVLGNLASATVAQPVVVPWSGSRLLTPPQLRNTLAHYLSSDARISTAGSSFGGQFARLAFPVAITEQAPFLDAGIPAALVSLSGARLPAANLTLAPVTAGGRANARIAQLGAALLQSVSSLDTGPAVGAPQSYLLISGKLVPAWAIRLLAAALLAPVLVATVDAVARARRRGHSVLRWVVWVLAGVVPFLVGLAALLVAGRAGILAAAPPGAVAAGGVSFGLRAAAVIVATLALVTLTGLYVRPLCLKLLTHLPVSERRPQSPPVDGAAVALCVVISLAAVVGWLLNPFAVVLIVPALHVWLWLSAPGLRAQRWALVPIVLAVLVPAAAVCAYYCIALGVSPLSFAWTVALMIAGGAMPLSAALFWCVTLGCFGAAILISVRSARAAAAGYEAPVTVRGPVTYAGPGSLGGTKSALRR